MVTLGVVADTHVPDRMRALPPALFEALAGVDAILHAGDVCVQPVLDALARVAPVHAVRGNRDFFMRLPRTLTLEFDGVRLGLVHGHGGLLGYMLEKLRYYTVGFYHASYLRQVRSSFSDVDVIVCGHSHRPYNDVVQGTLLFNPGSVGPDYPSSPGPAVGRLTIRGGAVRGEIIPLPTREQCAASPLPRLRMPAADQPAAPPT